MSKHEGKIVELVARDGGLIIGSWTLPGKLIDNYKIQESIGWHIFKCFSDGDTKVEVRLKEF